MRKLTLALALVFGALLAAPAAASIGRFRGGVIVAPVYRPWGFGPWGYWGYGPWYGPWGYSVGLQPDGGRVKIDTKLKDAQVFIDGAYAGTVKEVNSMWLRQGAYDLEVRAPGGAKFDTKVYVVGGKTIRVRPDLGAGGNS